VLAVEVALFLFFAAEEVALLVDVEVEPVLSLVTAPEEVAFPLVVVALSFAADTPVVSARASTREDTAYTENLDFVIK
jgi:hypothetical protein